MNTISNMSNSKIRFFNAITGSENSSKLTIFLNDQQILSNFDKSSPYFSFSPGTFTLKITTSNNITMTSNITTESSKCYTIVIRGICGNNNYPISIIGLEDTQECCETSKVRIIHSAVNIDCVDALISPCSSKKSKILAKTLTYCNAVNSEYKTVSCGTYDISIVSSSKNEKKSKNKRKQLLPPITVKFIPNKIYTIFVYRPTLCTANIVATIDYTCPKKCLETCPKKGPETCPKKCPETCDKL